MRRNKFNKEIKSKKNQKHDAVAAAPQTATSSSSFIRASVRKPGPAMLGLASVMMATNAMAQEALPTIDVQETTNNGGAGGYQATAPQVSRVPTPLLNTPQTVNVVTQQVLQEQRLTSMEDALRTVPGITFAAGEGGNQGDTPIIRGFAARGDIFRDGIRDPGWYTRDLFNVDRVEVYKGPSAFAFGRGSTGGAINLVTKLPTGIPYIEGFVTGTTAGGYRTELDASGKKDNVSGRIAAMYQDMPTPGRDNVGVKRWGVAPSIKIDLNPETRAIVSYIYQGEESVPDYGVPYLPAPTRNSSGVLTNGGYYGNGQATAPIPVPRSNWYGVRNGPLADVVRTDTHIGTIKVERDLAPDLKISNATRYVSNNRFAINTAPRSLLQADNTTAVTPGYPVDQMTIGRQHFQIETNNTLLTNQTDIGGKFYTGSLLHTFSAGLETTRETRYQQRARGVGPTGTASNLCDPAQLACRTSAYYPVDTSFGGFFGGWNTSLSTETTTVAAYAFDQIKINEYFEVLGSIRHDYYKAEFGDPGNATAANRNLGRTDDMTSWRVGGVFHPTKNSSVYAAYGTSFNPSAEFGVLSSAVNNAASPLLDPEKNTTIEVGAKADFLNNKLSVTGAIFRIEKTNLRISSAPADTTAALVLDGLARVDGIELGIAGALTDKWQVFAGYSYLQSEIVSTRNLAELGRELPGTPHNNFNLWTSYAITPDLTIGGGVQYQDDAFANTTNTTYVPSFWKFDAMAAYKVTRNSTLQLNVYNIGDAMYYAQYYAGHAVPASGRYASLTYRIRFEPEPAVVPAKYVK
ncbi:catecholate siderophore receptor [Afipia massiliensis]|uniref:Catecholate siderophore receptor n=1 Tax=Afipia massiliensis TaxID=211460 RepID=A0A840N0W4_9BRAD|nr:TonB-dependent siderophore receptor [Afipia massiliensis]MBB5052284.1 catecholate siderophore receptor [Afipia massiliensis]